MNLAKAFKNTDLNYAKFNVLNSYLSCDENNVNKEGAIYKHESLTYENQDKFLANH